MSFNCYEHYKQYKVNADSIEDFLKIYTKYDKHEGRGKDYVKCRIESHKEDLKKYGFTFIIHHDSITGETVAFYGNEV